jgi:hypothetical protein
MGLSENSIYLYVLGAWGLSQETVSSLYFQSHCPGDAWMTGFMWASRKMLVLMEFLRLAYVT